MKTDNLSLNALNLLNHMKEGYGITEFMVKDKPTLNALDELKQSGLIEYRRPLGWFVKDSED
jgi:hypothetical protein